MIKKAILPVAGMGTRFLPVTKASPKEMLPIVDKPVIQYIVEEAVKSGIEEIIFVTGKGKQAIEDYFDDDEYLVRLLTEKNKINELNEIKKLENIAKIIYVRQHHPLGDGHAILCAEHCISKGEDFAVLFGDDIIDSNSPALKQLIDVYNEKKTSVICTQEITGKEIENYGVVGFSNSITPTHISKKEELLNISKLVRVTSLQEKPKKEEALSNLGIIGKYVCTNDIFDAIKSSKKTNNEELKLIDGFKVFLENKKEIYAKIIEGTRYDTGSKIGWLNANIAFAMKNENMRNEIIKSLKKYV